MERVTIQPETATEEAARGRRMSEAGETVTRQPVLVAVGTDRSSRTEISSSGSVSVRDSSDTERVSLAQSGVSVRGTLLLARLCAGMPAHASMRVPALLHPLCFCFCFCGLRESGDVRLV